MPDLTAQYIREFGDAASLADGNYAAVDQGANAKKALLSVWRTYFQGTLPASIALKANTADLGAAAFSNDYSDLDNLPTLFDGAYASLAGLPTTLAGYGITDAVPSARTVNGHALSGDVTVTPTDLGLVIGVNVQAYDADLDGWAGKTPYAGSLVITTGKIATITDTLTLSGTDGSTLNVGTGGTLGTAAYTAASAYEVPLTFSTGLTRSVNTITVDTSVIATKAYADSLVVGLLDDRGNYDASGNVFPSSGGSGSAGAILKGDLWTISVAGTLGGTAVTAGDLVRALIDTPGQTAGNWAVSETNIGYTALNAALNDGQIYIGNSSNVGTARTFSGDVTVSNLGVTAIGSSKVVSAMLNADVFSTAHSWGGQQTLTAPILGTPASGTLTNCTGLPPVAGIVGWPANASGVLTNNGSGTLSWAAAGGSSPGGSGSNLQYRVDATTFGGVTNSVVSGGNLGLGATPDAILTVAAQTAIVAPVSGSIVHYVGLDANPLRLTYDTHNNASASGTALMGRRSRGTGASPTAAQSGDVLFSINGRGYGATQYAAASTGLISINANQNFTDTANGTYIAFSTTPDASVTAAEVGRFTSAGLQLGVSGTLVGSAAFLNATSGSITLQPTTGALGSAVLTMPAITGTILASGATQALATLTTALTYTTGVESRAWTGDTSTSSLFLLTDNNTSGSGYMVDVQATSSSSNMKPFRLIAKNSTIFDTTAAGLFTVTPAATGGIGSGNGFTVSVASTAITSGNLLKLTSTATSGLTGMSALNIAVSGVNSNTAQTITGGTISVTNTNGTSGTNVALTLTASGATTANRALDITAGQAIVFDGTAALPGIGFSGGTTTGIYRAATGVTGVSASGTAALGIYSGGIIMPSGSFYSFSSSSSVTTAGDTILRRSAAAALALGAAAVDLNANIVAQTLTVQGALTGGTSNQAGKDWTFDASQSKGNLGGGGIIWRVTPAGGSGTSLNAYSTAMTLASDLTLTLADTMNLVLNATTGTKIATATSQKLGFWNATPIIQPASANQAALTNSTGGTGNGTLEDVTSTGLADPAKCNNNFTELFTLTDAIRTALINAGLIKGAA